MGRKVRGKLIGAALALLAALPLMAGNAAPAAAAEKLVFAAGEWSPFISESLEGYGPHSRRVTEIFSAMGYDVSFEFMPWKRTREETKSGNYVATFSWLKTAEREDQFHFPRHPIAEGRNVAFFLKDRFPQGIKAASLEDLVAQNLKFVGISAFWYEEELKRLGAQLHVVTKADIAWKFLEAGRADVFVEELDVGFNDMKDAVKNPESFGQSSVVRNDPMYIMFSRAHSQGRELMEAYDAFLDSQAAPK